MYAALDNKNPGIIRACEDYLLTKVTDVTKIVNYAKSKNIDMVLIGPEAPLGEGLVDAFESVGIDSIGPTRHAAKIETSKSYMRNLMKKYKIPGLVKYGVFKDYKRARAFIEELDGEVAVKPVGLTGGKGVKIIDEHLANAQEAIEYAKKVIDTKIGGRAQVVIEQKMVGEEFTLQAFCDGKVAMPMPAVQDHKRAYEGDKGPNTGGMGSYSQSDGMLPFLSRDHYEDAALIVQKLVEALSAEGHPYKGIIYGQFMLTAEGPVVIECNARLGDPEAMNVLPLLRTDYLDICNAIINSTLSRKKISFSRKSTVCKYVVPRGYGTKSITGSEISVNEDNVKKMGAKLFYASVNETGGKLYTTSSRSLALVGIAQNIYDAEKIVERALTHVKGKDIYVRHDIGKKSSIMKKVKRMEMILKGNNRDD
jgi:phosphoribosylamine--glycine ligase